MKFPSHEEDYQLLENLNVGLVVCLNETIPPFDFKTLWKQDIRYIHCPINDYGVPQKLDAFFEWIDIGNEVVNNGKAVIVHCMAGLSRTGMAACCFLIKSQNFESNAAINLVNKTRGKSEKSHVMTGKQENYVKDFEVYLKKH